MTAFVAAGAGFLLAVLWFDLMFDVQVLRRGARRGGAPGDPAGPGPDASEAVTSIAAYYRRVTTAARPMGLLVGAVMLATLAAIAAQITSGEDPAWASWASLLLAGSAIGVAAAHTFPSAVRLGAGTDPAAVQLRLARSILRDHLLCLAAIGSVLVIQLAFAR